MGMESLGNPKTWVPYMNTKDCSQGFCSLYCPQWCYLVLPPPPPFEFPNDDSNSRFSPLVIAIIGILGSAFLLVSYYAVVSKYCRKRHSSSNRGGLEDPTGDLENNHSPSLHEPWNFGGNNGLDESLIKSIAVFKYKKGDGLVEGMDCSVCLNEFQEDESLRLLPKCSHAFHLPCIDTWLKSHSNCPLCRACIISTVSISPPQLPPAIVSTGSSSQNQAIPETEDSEQRDAIVEIRHETDLTVRRSVSMGQFSIADVLRMDEEQDVKEEDGVGSSNGKAAEIGKSSCGNTVLNIGVTSAAMKRSYSSGRFFFNRHGRWQQNPNIPV